LDKGEKKMSLWVNNQWSEVFKDPLWSPIPCFVHCPFGLSDIFERGASEFGLLNYETWRVVLQQTPCRTLCKPFHTVEARIKCSLHDCVDTMEFLLRDGIRFPFYDIVYALLQRLKSEHTLSESAYEYFKRCRQRVFKSVFTCTKLQRSNLNMFKARCKKNRLEDAKRYLQQHKG
jgi:hypothetical protein